MKKIKVGYCGLNSVFGRITTSLLKQSPCIQNLTIYEDDVRSSSGPIPHQANLYIGRDALFDALKDVNIVVIGDECYDQPDPDRLKLTGRKIKRYAEAIMKCSPNAIVVVAASPLNIVVPLASHLLGPEFSNRVLGSTCHDTLRASRLLNSLIGERYQTHRLHVLPVIGGATPTTRLPLFSQIYPQICMTDVMREKILERMRLFNTPSYQELDAMERAYSTVRFIHSLIVGITRGSLVPEITLSKSVGHTGFEYLSRPALLGGGGVQKEFPLPDLDIEEERILSDVTERLNKDALDAIDLANRLHDENQEEQQFSHRTASSTDEFQEDSYEGQFVKIEKKKSEEPERDEVNENLQKEDEYPGYAKKRVPESPTYAPRVDFRKSPSPDISSTNEETPSSHKTQDSPNESSESKANCLSLHACRLLEDPSQENECTQISDRCPEETTESSIEETDIAADVLQDEISRHLETLKSPTKSATQKFIELQQAKELVEDKREAKKSDSFMNFEADSEKVSSKGAPWPTVRQQKQMEPKVDSQENQGDADGTNRVHNLLSYSSQKPSHHEDERPETFSAANRKRGNSDQQLGSDLDQESGRRFSVREVATKKNEKLTNQGPKSFHENMSARKRALENEQVIETNERTDPNITSLEKEHPKAAQPSSRRQKSTPNSERNEGFSSARKNMAKVTKSSKSIKQVKDQTSKGKSVGKLAAKISRNSMRSGSEKKNVRKVADTETEQSKHTSLIKAKEKLSRRYSKTKTVAESENESVGSPTSHKTAENYPEKGKSLRGKSESPETSQNHKITEAKPSSSKTKMRGTNKGVILMSGHSDPEKSPTESVQPLVQKKCPKKESSKPEEGAENSGFEGIPEVRSEDAESAIISNSAKSRKLLNTDITKDYYNRERRVPLDASACSNSNRDSRPKPEQSAFDSKSDKRQSGSETNDLEVELKEICPTEAPKPEIYPVKEKDKSINNFETVIDEEHNIGAKWDSKYLSMASDMLCKFFKEAAGQSINANEVKKNFLSSAKDLKVGTQAESIYKQPNDFGETFCYSKGSKAFLKEISLDDFANSGRVNIGLLKNRLSASDLNYKRRAKYTESKFKPTKNIALKPKRKPSGSGIEKGNMLEKPKNVRLQGAKSARRISDQNSQQSKACDNGKSSNTKDQDKPKTKDEPGPSTEHPPTIKKFGEDKKVDFDQLFKESSQIPILEARRVLGIKSGAKENGENSKNVRPLSKLQANTKKPDDLMTPKLPKVTSDRGHKVAVNLVDFSTHPKSDLPNTDSWDTFTKPGTPRKPTVDRSFKSNDPGPGVTKLDVTAPKPNVVPILSKTIKQANLGQLGNSGPLRRSGNGETPKPNKWERVFTVFKQILINDVEGKNLENDSDSIKNDFSSENLSAIKDKRRPDQAPVDSLQNNTKTRQKRLETPVRVSSSQSSGILHKNRNSSIQKKKHVVEGMKRRKFVPKNTPKKIVNYFSKRVETSEPKMMHANLSTASGCEMPSMK